MASPGISDLFAARGQIPCLSAAQQSGKLKRRWQSPAATPAGALAGAAESKAVSDQHDDDRI
jgi:hypothetical protein